MPKILSILLIGIGGYFLLTRRYRIVNTVLKSPMIRQYLIKIVMNLPGLRNKMMSNVFSKPTVYQ